MTSHLAPPRPRLTNDAIEKLAYLASMLEISGPDRPLVIRHGECTIRLDPNGTISVTGRRILQDADQNIALRAGWIDIN